MVKQISYNEIYLLIKYIKNVLWRVAKHLSHIEDVRCLKVNKLVYFRDELCVKMTVYRYETVLLALSFHDVRA